MTDQTRGRYGDYNALLPRDGSRPMIAGEVVTEGALIRYVADKLGGAV